MLCTPTLKVCAGMAGACLLDLRYPAMVYLGADPFPEVVTRLHNAVQRGRESPSRLWLEVSEGCALAGLVTWACVTGRRRYRALEGPR
jgi:hypothetical protein